VVPPGGRSRRAAQLATTCSNRAPAWLDGVVQGAGGERLNHQVVSFKSPADTPKCPECCGNLRLLCRGTRSSNPSPPSRESANFRSLSRCRRSRHAVAARALAGTKEAHAVNGDKRGQGSLVDSATNVGEYLIVTVGDPGVGAPNGSGRPR
jgi:hypothetical protein